MAESALKSPRTEVKASHACAGDAEAGLHTALARARDVDGVLMGRGDSSAGATHESPSWQHRGSARSPLGGDHEAATTPARDRLTVSARSCLVVPSLARSTVGIVRLDLQV